MDDRHDAFRRGIRLAERTNPFQLALVLAAGLWVNARGAAKDVAEVCNRGEPRIAPPQEVRRARVAKIIQQCFERHFPIGGATNRRPPR